jgi:hypothetical protein
VIPPVTQEPVATPVEEKPAPEQAPVELEFPAIAAENPAEKPETPRPPRRPSRPRPPTEQELF